MQEGRFLATEADHVGPHTVIEDIALQSFQSVRMAPDGRALRAMHVNVVDKQRQRRQMIEVRMRQKNVLHAALSIQRRKHAQHARVDGHRVIDDARCQNLIAIRATDR